MAAEIVKLVQKPVAPVAPKGLSKDAKAEWLRLYPLLKAKGTLTPENEPLLTAYVNGMAMIAGCDREIGKKLVTKGPTGVMRPNPLIGPRNKAAQTTTQLAKRLGILGDGRTPPPDQGGGDAWSKLDL